jgi:hypothetical protein
MTFLGILLMLEVLSAGVVVVLLHLLQPLHLQVRLSPFLLVTTTVLSLVLITASQEWLMNQLLGLKV